MQDFLEMDRRSLMKNVALLLGAASVPTLAGCKAAMQGDGTLSGDAFKTLAAVADTIIPVTDTPGALAAKVPELLNGLLRDWASDQTRTDLAGVVDAIAKAAQDAHKKPFAELDAATRLKSLTAFEAEALKDGPPPKVKPTGLAAMAKGKPVMNPAYVKLKGLIINLYYNSEIAMTKELVYEHVPGPFVASMKVTPETRPFAGPGPQ